MTAAGTAIQWYSTPTGGSPLADTDELIDGAHYYATQTDGCESISRLDVAVSVSATPPAPSGSAAQLFCSASSATIGDLAATGTSILWYPVPAGGTPLATGTLLGNGSHYYASQTVAGCESTSRLDVVVTINATPIAPTGPASQSFCGNSLPTLASLAVSGTAVQWYSASSGGTALPLTTLLVNGNHYYASQTVASCESALRLDVLTTVSPDNAIIRTSSAGTDAQNICTGSSIANIAYSTTGATGATVTGLPAGVTGTWLANVVTISGTPTVTGSFTYTVALTGGCGTISATGTIIISPNNTLSLTSPAGTNAQDICINTAISGITYATTGATGATVTGLPAGVSGSWAANTVTISGIPTVQGSFTYTVALTGGCGTVSATGTLIVRPTNTILRTSPAGSDAQTVCINSAINNITYSTTGASGATVTGLPAGITGNWAANVVTINGTPTTSGSFTYVISLTGGCGTITATGTINVTPANTVTRTSPAGTDAQTVCINTPITNITYSTTGATGATITGLPAGLTASWAANVVTITGSPSAVGTFPYTVTLTGGCGIVSSAGTIAVTASNTINRTSAAGTVAQTVCINTPISTITYATTGATGATVTGLPAGVTGTWLANVVTISGTPSVAGSTAYTVTLTGGCGTVTAAGTITVNPNNSISRTSPAGTDAQNVCRNSPITSITYSTTGASGATVTGLPAGVSGSWLANVLTISGSPNVTGTYSYTVTLTGGCGTVTATGSIIVAGINTINRTSAPGVQSVCAGETINNITYATTGATGATITGLPAGVTGAWAANVVTISGTPTIPGPVYNFTVTLTGGCGAVSESDILIVRPNNALNLTSAPGTDAQTVCIGTAITNITYSTTGATGATVTGLPAGVTGIWASNAVTISGTPTVVGASTYTVTMTGGCGTVTATGTITVTPDNTVALTSPSGTNAQTVCIGTAITNITYSTTGATGATVTGLPAGVTGTWAANAVTISGTPTVAGGSTYTVTLTGGCGTVTATGTITVTPDNTVALTSPAGTDAQTVCIGTPITNITYSTTGATGATVTGLPAGVTGTWAANVVTISGTPTVAGASTYTVTLTGGCGTVTATGTITVTPDNTVALTSPAGTDAQTVCINTAITNITYSTTGATGATVTGLPAGVTGTWAADAVTISGTPTVAGASTYTITLTGGCGTVTATGTITVTPDNTVALTSPAGTDAQTVCMDTPITNITYSTTGATGATVTGLPAGVTGIWAADAVTISGTPTVAGASTYTVTLTGGCGTVTATGTITVTPDNTIALTSPAGTDAQTVCVGYCNNKYHLFNHGSNRSNGNRFTGRSNGYMGIKCCDNQRNPDSCRSFNLYSHHDGRLRNGNCNRHNNSYP